MEIKNKVRINKKTYRVKWVDSFKDGSLGKIFYRTKEIQLAHKLYSKRLNMKLRLTKAEKLEVYVHELVHGILRDMKRHDLNNERFVDALSRRLLTVLTGK